MIPFEGIAGIQHFLTAVFRHYGDIVNFYGAWGDGRETKDDGWFVHSLDVARLKDFGVHRPVETLICMT